MTYANLVLVTRRVDAGTYIVNDRYVVARELEGWRWWDGTAPAVGGWSATKTGAVADLQAHVDAPRKALRPDWNWRP